jgi:hypothetical protein
MSETAWNKQLRRGYKRYLEEHGDRPVGPVLLYDDDGPQLAELAGPLGHHVVSVVKLCIVAAENKRLREQLRAARALLED